jgi:hypothetical protein
LCFWVSNLLNTRKKEVCNVRSNTRLAKSQETQHPSRNCLYKKSLVPIPEDDHECKIVTLLNAPNASSLGRGLANPAGLFLRPRDGEPGNGVPGVVALHSPDPEGELIPSFHPGVAGIDEGVVKF